MPVLFEFVKCFICQCLLSDTQRGIGFGIESATQPSYTTALICFIDASEHKRAAEQKH